MAWIHELAAWMVGLANSPGAPWALVGVAFAEASFFPLPPDLLLIALGLGNPEQSFFLAALCTVGSTCGGAFGYWIGRWGGRPLLRRLMSQERIAAVERQFQRYDMWAVGIAGFTPIPYKVFTIASGAFRLRFWRFVLVSACSRGARFFLVAAVVAFFGAQAAGWLREYFNWFTIGFVVLLIGGALAVRLLSRVGRPQKSAKQIFDRNHLSSGGTDQQGATGRSGIS